MTASNIPTQPAVGVRRSADVVLSRTANGDLRFSCGADALPDGGMLCLYDAAKVPATDFAAPAGGPSSLIAALAASAVADGAIEAQAADDLDLHAADRLIAQYRAPAGTIYGGALSLIYETELQPSIDPSIAEWINLDRGAQVIDAIAADYERRFLAEGSASETPSLNMAFFLSLVMSQVQDGIASGPLDPDRLRGLLSANYLAAYYCGIFFVRDGYQWDPPGTPVDPTRPESVRAANAFINLEFGMQSEVEVARMVREAVAPLDGSDDAAMAFLTHEAPEQYRNYIGGSGIRSLISNFGYNSGYSLTVNEQTARDALEPAPPGYFACEGYHPPLTSPEGPMPDGVLLGASYDPLFSRALPELAAYRDRFVAAFPDEAAALTAEQNREELRGRGVWTYRLHDGLKVDQQVRRTVWAFDNSYLNMVHVAALLNMAARVEGSPDLAHRAALAGSGVAKAYLWAYTMGVKSQKPRRIPRWNLGITPLRT